MYSRNIPNSLLICSIIEELIYGEGDGKLHNSLHTHCALFTHYCLLQNFANSCQSTEKDCL